MIHPAARVRSTVFAGSVILFVILSLVLFTGKAQAQSQTWYVDASNSGVSGTSWSDAFSNLQEALLVALPGDEIRVAGGSYRPDSGAGLIPGDPSTRFVLPSGISMLGGFAGSLATDPDLRSPEVYRTVLDGRLQGIHVSAAEGLDSPFCGLNEDLPCATLQKGIDRALETGLRIVRVQTGIYTETVTLADDLIIQGGYDLQWNWASTETPGHEVVLTGGINGDGQAVTVEARNLVIGTTLAHLKIEGPQASGSVAGVARSSYAVHAVDSNLQLVAVVIEAGSGANGLAGESGTNLGGNPAADGQAGGNADSYFSFCDATAFGAGGLAGGGGPTGGGNGGGGGTMDSNCCGTIPNPFCDSYDATGGSAGADGAGLPGWGQGGGGGSTCNGGGDGAPGSQGISGQGGTGASAGGGLSGIYWAGNSGSSGLLGTAGGGGGGGGGSGGCDNGTFGTDSYGAGGGGGASGGIPSPQSGAGGSAGGSTFGIFVLGTSNVDLIQSTIVRGEAGAGGIGGTPGEGQPGGIGGAGGNGAAGTPNAGRGGDGGDGGASGGGGGGSGGDSHAAWSDGATIFAYDTSVLGGLEGPGAAGGVNPALDAVTQGSAGAGGQVFDGLTHVTTTDLPASPLDRSRQILELTGENSVVDGFVIQGSSNQSNEIPVVIGSSGHVLSRCHFLNLSSGALTTIQVNGFTIFENCRIENCQSAITGAVELLPSTVCRMENCIISNNRSIQGAAVLEGAADSVLLMINNTLTENENSVSGGLIMLDSNAQAVLQNNILFGNSTVDTGLQLPATAVLIRNIVEGGWPGDNFDVDPELTGTGEFPFTPGPGSPCVDQALSVASSTTEDCLGQPRSVCQGVDIGAVERQTCGDGDSLDFIRGDCDGNGSIDLADAVALLDYLFTGGSLTCLATADVNDDSDMNLADPGTLLAYLYIGGSAPPEPFTSCGQDGDGSLIACEVYGGCP